MKIVCLFLVLLILNVNLCFAEDVEGSESAFGVDYIFPYVPYYQDSKLPQLFREAGMRWANFVEFGWAKIEPKAPVAGRHNYKWETLDKAVQLWQSYDFHIVMTIKCGSEWGGGEVKSEAMSKVKGPLKKLIKNRWAKKIDRLPAEEHMQDYRDYIKALIERYDADGINDMPGLKYSILHYQIGNEYVHEGFWAGTVEDYGALLEETYKAAKEANHSVKIILAGITWNDLFAGDLEGTKFQEVFERKMPALKEIMRQGWYKAKDFTIGSLKFYKNYDIIDARGNGPFWQAYPGYIKWLKRELKNNNAQDEEIWDIESRSEPDIRYNQAVIFHKELVCERGEEILKQMKKVPMFNRNNHRFWKWYRAEQARQIVKVLTTRLGEGAKKVFIGFPMDVDFSAIATLGVGGMAWIGMLDKNLNPNPNYYAYKQVVDKIGGFSRAEQKIENDIWHYIFYFDNGKKVHVVWLDSNKAPDPDRELDQKEINVAVSANQVSLTEGVTSIEVTNPAPKTHSIKGGRLSFAITETPVFIEE